MSTVTLKISPAVAAFVAPGATNEMKIQGVTTAASMSAVNRVVLLFCLTRDSDLDVKRTAISAFSALPAEVLAEYIDYSGGHPSIFDLIARLHFEKSHIVVALLENQALSSQARVFLEKQEFLKVQALEDDQLDLTSVAKTEEIEGIDDEVSEEDVLLTDLPPDEELEEEAEQPTEEYFSKYQMAQLMGIGEKIKMALTGDKEWRAILIKDANKLVSGSVIKNPRITDGEVLTILKVGVQNDEIIRLICANKEWVKNYKIRKALVESPKTPLPNALRYLASLGEKDIAGYAKSKNISSVLSTQAKRILLAKKR